VTLYPRERVDAAHAAAVLRANGSTLPDGITDAAGYEAYRHPDRDAGDAWFRHITEVPGITLIAFDVTERGWLYLYDVRAAR
jgi:hypothetical protein